MYSPESNPIEMMWRYLKDRIANVAHKTLDDLSDSIAQRMVDLTPEIIKSITSYDYYEENYHAVF
jgi:transposase